MKSSSSSSSFKRKIASKSIELAPGLRCSPSSSFSNSSLPVFSTGLTALDDLISGKGQPSSSSLFLFPSINTASTLISNQDESTDLNRSTSEPYTELVLAYGIAQGLTANHKVILVGHDLNGFTKGIMAKIGQEEEENEKDKVEKKLSGKEEGGKEKEEGDEDDEDDDEEDEKEKEKEIQNKNQTPLNSKGEKMDIAWRYEKMKQFKTSIDSTSGAENNRGDEQDLFCSVYDLSKRISSKRLQQSKTNGNLVFISIDQEPDFKSSNQNQVESFESVVDTSSFKSGDPNEKDEDFKWEQEKRRLKGKQRVIDHEVEEINSFEIAFQKIQAIVNDAREKVKQRCSSSHPPQPIRICIRSLGSSTWKIKSNQSRSLETIRFLSKLKILLRSTSFFNSKDSELLEKCQIKPSKTTSSSSSSLSTSTSTQTIPTILTVSISSHLLSSSSCNDNCSSISPSTTTLSQILSNLSDSTILFSNFQISNLLRFSFPSYTGGIKILKTPKLGTLLDSSIKTSVLRGMGNTLSNSSNDLSRRGGGGGEGGSGGAGDEGGTGGTENNLAFKLKRKKFVVETLHLDVENEKEEKKKKNEKEKKKEKAKEKELEEVISFNEIDRNEISSSSSSSSLNQEDSNRNVINSKNVIQNPNSTSSSSPSFKLNANTNNTPKTSSNSSSKPSFGGLKALRQRGLEEQNKNKLNSDIEVSVGIDNEINSKHNHNHDHSKGLGNRSRNGIKTPVFKSDKMKDYEF